jgi:micrococcal nuclease
MGRQNWHLGLAKAIAPCLICFLLICFLGSCQSSDLPSGDRVRVSRATSGQTLEVLAAQNPQIQNSQTQNPQTQKVRMLGIEAPWVSQKPWGDQAWKRLQELVNGKTVLLESDVEKTVQRQDGSQIKLAYVWLDGVLLNQQLVEEGLALAKSRSPNTKYDQLLAAAQEKARLLGLGIWNPAQPMRQPPGALQRSL